MAVTRYRDGAVTVTLDGALEAFVRQALEAAGGETVRLLEAEGAKLAAEASAEWYRRVDRETGRSGDIQTVTTVDVTREEVRVSIGSTDTRVAGKSGKLVPVFVHAPYPTSLSLQRVDHATYWAAPEGMRKKYPMILAPNPKAGDGKKLLVELVRKPSRALVLRLTPDLARQIAARMRR